MLPKFWVAGTIAVWLLLGLGTTNSFAQEPGVHYLHHGIMPPGAIGGRQLLRGGPLCGYYQPVEIKAPAGVLISLAVGGQFDQPRPVPVKVGMLIGQVYRLRVTKIPLHEGDEVFPSIEVIDRTHPPAGQERRFPIPIELTKEDLELAISGKFVTRVIYLEDPQRALPVASADKPQNWFDIGPGRDPLAAADALGRPVAILRLGGRLPTQNEPLDEHFFFGCPPWLDFPTVAPVAAQARPAPNTDRKPSENRQPAAQPRQDQTLDGAPNHNLKVLPPPPDRAARRPSSGQPQ